MNHYRNSVIIAIVALLFSAAAYSQNDPFEELDWQFGPTEGHIGDKAQIKIPEGYVFLGSKDTKIMMELMENIPSDNEYLLAPDDLSWFAIFEFNPVGYVKDNETLDPESLLDTVTRGTEQGNIERRRRGWNTMSILGWQFQPQYDRQTNLLEWAFIAKDDNTNEQVINYNTRILGRTGVMQVVLVAGLDVLETSMLSLKYTLTGYSFVPGEKYAEYREGDRIAEYGLAALIAGGAAAVATKKGFWAALAGFFAAAWKIVVAAVVGLLAWIGSLFKKRT